MLQTIKKMALTLAGALGVSAANAQSVITPPGQGPNFAWDFFTLGNGEVLFSILNAVSLMVNSGTFSDIITIIALIGIFIAAVMGGFNPGQNAIKMVTYFLMVFFVIVVTFQISINVKIQDQVTGYENVVTDVPAVIGFPAVFVSAVGHGIADVVETAVNIPEGLGVTSGGGFMLIPSMMADMSKIQINDPNLQASMANYSMDCVVAGVANGSINPREIPVSNDLWATLAYPNEGILTRYIAKLDNQVTASVVSCKDAHTAISNRLEEIAPELLAQGMGGWASTGAVAFASAALDNSLTWITNGGAPTGGAQTLKQSAVISAYSDSFAKGAAMTNNNEMLMSLTMEQALASQKTGWFTAAEIFKNTMGYIYSVLQAFIFGITPIVAAMLLIPGLGTKIFMNYAQILIWLVLWEPMLTIVNFIISVFTRQQVGPIFVGGMTMADKPVVTEFSNNLILAGSFLMTLVPVISWGLVKGGMAFTEFISAGLGSSFSSMAATQAVSGNINMNNMSMNNMSMGQRNLASQTSVGYQQTQGFYGAGAGLSESQLGGNGLDVNGKAATGTQKISVLKSDTLTDSQLSQKTQEIAQTASAMTAQTRSLVQTYQTSSQYQRAVQDQEEKVKALEASVSSNDGTQAANARATATGTSVSGSVEAGLKVAGSGAGASAEFDAQKKRLEEAKETLDYMKGNKEIDSAKAANSVLTALSNSISRSTAGSSGSTSGLSNAVSEAVKLSDTLSTQVASLKSQSYAVEIAMPTGMTPETFAQEQGKFLAQNVGGINLASVDNSGVFNNSGLDVRSAENPTGVGSMPALPPVPQGIPGDQGGSLVPEGVNTPTAPTTGLIVDPNGTDLVQANLENSKEKSRAAMAKQDTPITAAADTAAADFTKEGANVVDYVRKSF